MHLNDFHNNAHDGCWARTAAAAAQCSTFQNLNVLNCLKQILYIRLIEQSFGNVYWPTHFLVRENIFTTARFVKCENENVFKMANKIYFMYF